MKILAEGGGTWLIDDEGSGELAFYADQGMEWDNDGTSCLKCGDSCLYEDVEILDGDIEGECTVKISYLQHVGGARYERSEYHLRFSGREKIGSWEEI